MTVSPLPLQLRGVSMLFRSGDIEVAAVREVDLEVRTGELLAIVGPSGSGKTTLLSIAGCLLSPTRGQVFVLGQEATSLGQSQRAALRLKHIGFVFQSFNLLPALSALENVEIALNLAGAHGEAAWNRANQLLENLELGERRDVRPDRLSGGEQQRLAVARALANRPDVILADEPTASLDSGSGRRVINLMRQAVQRGEAQALVVVTHDTRILDLVDRVLFMEDGRLSAAATSSAPAGQTERG